MAISPVPSPSHAWQDIARQLAAETNSENIARLAEELNVALETEERLKRVPFKSVVRATQS